MRSFLKVALSAAVVGIFMVAGCSKDSGTSAPSGVTGTWKATQNGITMTVVFNANNTFTLDAGGLATMNGTYTYSGNTVTMTATSCTVLGQPSSDCGDPTTGTVSGNTMTMDNGDGTTSTLTKA